MCTIKYPFRWTAVFAYYAVVLFLLLSPADYYEGFSFPFADKLAHLFLFLILGALLQYTAVGIKRTFCGGIILAGISELLQLCTPTRTADLFDFLFDVVGVFIGAQLLTVVQKKIIAK